MVAAVALPSLMHHRCRHPRRCACSPTLTALVLLPLLLPLLLLLLVLGRVHLLRPRTSVPLLLLIPLGIHLGLLVVLGLLGRLQLAVLVGVTGLLPPLCASTIPLCTSPRMLTLWLIWRLSRSSRTTRTRATGR